MPGTNDRDEQWAGGFGRVVGAGRAKRRAYVIRRLVGGKRYKVSTRQSNEAAALLELASFERSPANYGPTPPPDLLGDEVPAPIFLDAAPVQAIPGSLRAVCHAEVLALEEEAGRLVARAAPREGPALARPREGRASARSQRRS